MLEKLGRSIVLAVAMSLLYAGPVAACICIDEPMPEMPCCPDESPDQGAAASTQGDFAVDIACESVPADLLTTGSRDLPSFVSIASFPVPQAVPRTPRKEPLARAPVPHESPPIYLVTLRLRD